MVQASAKDLDLIRGLLDLPLELSGVMA